MRLSRIVRQNYDRRPYPAVGTQKRYTPTWQIAPMRWIEAMWSRQDPPGRILVAGCGTGNEVFALHRVYPKAEIVGIDFSRRSIVIARNLHRRFFGQAKLKFGWADVTSRNFKKSAGGEFDFITCHGVLSYIEKPARGIAALESCLARDGALYLGVNGSIHLSQFWRPGLSDFGIDPQTFEDRSDLRRILKLFDAMAGHDLGFVSDLGAEYLSSDLFGPVIHTWPLSRWTRLCAQHGLFLRGSYWSHRILRAVINHELYEQLLPRTRAQAHELADKIAPTGFHWLVLDRHRESAGLWTNETNLLRHAIVQTKLYKIKWPAQRKIDRPYRKIVLKSESTNTQVEAKLPAILIELIRRANQATDLRDLLQSLRARIKPAELRKYLYLLYLLGAINFRRPEKTTTPHRSR